MRQRSSFKKLMIMTVGRRADEIEWLVGALEKVQTKLST
jgi:hypothetical protein